MYQVKLSKTAKKFFIIVKIIVIQVAISVVKMESFFLSDLKLSFIRNRVTIVHIETNKIIIG